MYTNISEKENYKTYGLWSWSSDLFQLILESFLLWPNKVKLFAVKILR